METKPEVKKRPPRTLKERRFVKALATAPSATQAVIDAGYDVKSRLVARNIAAENMAKLDIPDLMESQGLTDSVLLSALSLGLLDAMKMDNYTGEVTPDYAVRHKYLETALRLKGLAVFKDENGDTNIQINVTNYGKLHADNPSV